MRTGTPALIALLALSIASCKSSRDGTAVRDPADPAPAQRVDKQAEAQKIRGLEGRWREALAAKDSMAIGGFYAQDGIYLPQNSTGYEGMEKIRGRWTSEITGGKFDLRREPKRIEVADAGDMAYEVGTYKVSWDKPKEKQKGQGFGNYVTVWKKENGDWKTTAYIWNRGEQR